MGQHFGKKTKQLSSVPHYHSFIQSQKTLPTEVIVKINLLTVAKLSDTTVISAREKV